MGGCRAAVWFRVSLRLLCHDAVRDINTYVVNVHVGHDIPWLFLHPVSLVLAVVAS